MDLRLDTSTFGTATVVGVAGEIDNYTAPQLQDTLVAAFEGQQVGVVDLTETDFLDSSGLGVLVGTSKRLAAAGGGLRVVCPQPQLRKLFEISHLDEVIAVFDSLENAVPEARDR